MLNSSVCADDRAAPFCYAINSKEERSSKVIGANSRLSEKGRVEPWVFWHGSWSD